MLTPDRWPKSLSAAAPPDGCACTVALEAVSNPCTACSAQLMDWRRLRSPDDVQRHRLMRVAAQAFHFEVAVPGVNRIAQRRRRLRRPLEAEHPLIPGLAGQTVGGLARLRCLFCGGPNRRPVNDPLTWCPSPIKAGRRAGANRPMAGSRPLPEPRLIVAVDRHLFRRASHFPKNFKACFQV